MDQNMNELVNKSMKYVPMPVHEVYIRGGIRSKLKMDQSMIWITAGHFSEHERENKANRK
jgi:hypothetical protein